jgi:2-amino-4-hydroxy-6-hydroxymethyldihydropteridine diphosphokinase
MTMPRAGIALGSNLGDRLKNLRAALDALREIATPGEPVLAAPVYQTEPRFCPPGSPDFLNTVVEIGFGGGPLELLEKTRAMEIHLGRLRGTERNAPRVIDIDLLYLGDVVFENAVLTLPHPRIGGRRFVLQPLADIRPELVLPGHTQTIADILADLKTDEPLLIPVSSGGLS